MAALLEREVSGEGQWVQTSLLESQIAMLDFQAAQWLIDHKVPQSTGNEHPLTVPTGVFETQDGFINLAAIGNTMFKRLCHALDIPQLIDEPGLGSDPERVKNRARVNAAVGAAFRQRSTAEWTERLLKAGVPCGPIYQVDQMFADPQVRHLGVARTMHHPELGDIQVVGLPMNFSRYPRNEGPLTAAPHQGDQTEAILCSLGYDARQITDLRARFVV
jgi:crotonobetainyl-CoA:carnitine CoA-transferase CaiB-like acyl-CoA transferase